MPLISKVCFGAPHSHQQAILSAHAYTKQKSWVRIPNIAIRRSQQFVHARVGVCVCEPTSRQGTAKMILYITCAQVEYLR